MGNRSFQVIEEKRIRTTKDSDSLGTLVNWITEIAGEKEAIEVQGWTEICEDGEYYEGENFEIICLG